MSSKPYPFYKIWSVLGRHLLGRELRQYGLPYTNAFGLLAERYDEGILDLMFLAIERFPEIHPVSAMPDGRYVNRFHEEARYCMLYLGNNDPDIEFLPHLEDDSEECRAFQYSSPGFVDLSNNSLTQEQEFAIQCLKNRLAAK